MNPEDTVALPIINIRKKVYSYNGNAMIFAIFAIVILLFGVLR
jgi:hypothetical protein